MFSRILCCFAALFEACAAWTLSEHWRSPATKSVLCNHNTLWLCLPPVEHTVLFWTLCPRVRYQWSSSCRCECFSDYYRGPQRLPVLSWWILISSIAYTPPNPILIINAPSLRNELRACSQRCLKALGVDISSYTPQEMRGCLLEFGGAIGAFIIRIGFRGPLYYTYNREPSKIV